MDGPFPFRFRLNCVDHYQAAPTQFDPHLFGQSLSQGKKAPAVPVIRAFGATETGQKVCAHIHGALPYLYIEYNGSLAAEDVNAYIRDLRMSIDHALAISYRRNPYDGKAIFVGHICLVKGVPFFGYHVGYKFYLKIYLLNPLHTTRFADLLYQGAIMQQIIQPHESHLQYLLQWMCDYNLYGCAYIDCAIVKFRDPVPEYMELSNLAHRWHDRTILPEWISNPDNLPRQSHCAIEIDIRVEDILNRHEVHERPLHHDFIERFQLLGPEDKFVHSMAGLWKDETKRRKKRMGITDPSSSPFPKEVLVSMSADARGSQKWGWIHEDEYRELVDDLVKGEKTGNDGTTIGFDDFVKPATLGDQVKTALESVEDLFSERLRAGHEQASDVETQLRDEDANSEALIDEKKIAFLDYDIISDEEVAEELALSQRLREIARGPKSNSSRSRRNESGILKSSDEVDNYIESDRPLKKRRIDSSPLKRVAFQDSSSELLKGDSDLTASQSSSPLKSDLGQLSQSSIKAHGRSRPTTVSFPVVKNPQDPDTALRLSQRSEWSNSQKAERTPKTTKTDAASEESPATPWTVSKSASSTSTGENSLGPEVSSQALKLASKLDGSFLSSNSMLLFGELPPSAETVQNTMLDWGLPPVLYQDAYYSDERDVPERPREYAGREFKLQSTTIPYLPDFDPTGSSLATYGERSGVVVDKVKEELQARRRRRQCTLRNWQIADAPPTAEEVQEWLEQERLQQRGDADPDADVPNAPPGQQSRTGGQKVLLSQIDGPTQKNKHGFKYSQKLKSTSVHHETQYMSIMSLEVHVNTRDTFVPDPAEDPIAAIFWCIQSDDDEDTDPDGLKLGILALSSEDGIASKISRQVSVAVEYEEDELNLINRMVDIVRGYDPDILTGYEVHNSSWGYLIERARLKYEYNLPDEFSRMKSQSHGRFGKEADRWGFTHTSTIRVTGRHMINIWRAMRGELNLLQYTMENVVFHVLHKRIPHYSFADLTRWYQNGRPRDLAKMVSYFLSRVQLNLQILETNELIARTSEQARLLGVDFFSVFSRGSQFKVESLMFRIAKPENYILVSPSRKQIGQQNALECLPLVMEPQSAFYPSPLLVLDFQSLYPSVMIAYNYCYSTCLGRIVSWRGQNKLGFTDFKRDPGLLELVKDYINIAPNGLMYVKPEMRKSLLAKMLGEILETRVMVKSGMKVDKDDKTLQQLLNNRQLALKLIANVTYGYTSASFSGRMPCSEIADSIVQTGRETLEKAIALIHSVNRWGAEVVYGDTDSLFVYLKGRTREEAFQIGNEIADTVTKANPKPVKLKFEKVYHPCVLLAKKRYVGFKYESPTQKEPEFDAKGIETVRRDGTPAEQKIEEKALKILFRSQDLSEVKSYFQRQCTKIMNGRVSIQDFLFAREVKLGSYSDKGPPPPGALIATRRMLNDHRTEPQYGERIPYVVVTGAPGARLIDRCIAPEALLTDDNLELDAEYYISKNLIPPLERIFNLVGANVRGWYDEMPKVQRIRTVSAAPQANAFGQVGGNMRRTLENYMKSSACILCRDRLPPVKATAKNVALLPLCKKCLKDKPLALLSLNRRLQKAEMRVQRVDAVCQSCAGLAFGEEVRCDSRDCPVFYTRVRERAHLRSTDDNVGDVITALEALPMDDDLRW
ncbi:hypothetical protein NA57DRAFT_51786 [Rhizodiscina lignyota]|uniref:DNA polymerase n=1 Tax=Rhizodiscina lignyota TaxID=1504668 RepID=A0A9P4ITC7_9PEZI|nr:hypothetical protein NA57DRAFT_51786 [Rhizodiscina lignyota]